MADKVDPFDVEALESAVNDSATRVSTIWISFLIFSLYLLITATTVTQRQLLLAEPVKLPVLNIDLPLWGFFFLAPILFVILHAYVLLQVVLLGRTTAAYNAAVARVGLSPEENNSLRQRLANTLFAQIFAGSPREREGFIGWLLKAMAWITLAIAPILILLAFQFSFLAYHSHIATWTHRALIFLELAALFLIWPLALDAQKDFQWPRVGAGLKRAALMWRLFGPKERRRDDWQWLRQKAAPLAACLLFVIFSLWTASFPGEPHVNMFTMKPLSSVQCDRWLQKKFGLIDLQFDRLDLPHVDAVDHQKLEQIEGATRKAGEMPSQGERTRVLRDRDLNCGDFSNYADLRRIDFTGARLISVDFTNAILQGASLANAELQDASLFGADLQDASLVGAQLRGALLMLAKLQGAILNRAQLQGVSLFEANLRGATFRGAQLQGASLNSAKLQGASFDARGAYSESELGGLFSSEQTLLQGAELNRAQLQGASLKSAQLQGATLNSANLQGADLDDAQLQGANLSYAILDDSVLSNVWTWRARNAACTKARVINHNPSNIVKGEPARMGFGPRGGIAATQNEIDNFIRNSVAKISDASEKDEVAARMREGLDVDPSKDDTADIAKVWSDCETIATKTPQASFDDERAEFLRNLVCYATEDRSAIAAGIIRNWVFDPIGNPLAGPVEQHSALSIQLARGLLGQDGRDCAATQDLDEETRNRLRAVANYTVSRPASAASEPNSSSAGTRPRPPAPEAQ
jgi:uncharacterized protein YjbI with pentapeptide repeats